MKKLVIISLLVSFIFTQQTTSYSWEDGTGTILGSYGNLANPANVSTTSGVSPYDGSRMLTVSESPIDGTPQAFIAWVTDLSAGQDIEACFYGYDNTPDSAPSLRIWGNWSANDDIASYGGSADGNSDYTAGSGWGQVCYTFSTNQETWDSGEALVIQARLYSSGSGPDPTVYFIDLVEVTAPSSVTVNYPGTSEGCTNPSACNYNPYASGDDGSCFYPEGSISIYDIQYTSDQGEYCYESVHDQECWTTSGTVMAINPIYSNFYIQDENSNSYAGIYIHAYSATLPNLGENITLTATVNEYYSLTQLINGASFSVNSSGTSIGPTDISTSDLASGCTAAGESVESMLVRINNVVVTTTSNEFGEWYVSDGSGSVMINDKIFDGEWLDPSSSQEFASIVGVVDYAYSEFSILPRTMNDIDLCPTCPVADAGDNQLVAPGTPLVTLDGSGSSDPNGTIIFYEWSQNSGTAVTLGNEEAAVTTFTAPNTTGDLIFTLTVYDNDYNESIDQVIITVGTGTTIQDIQCPSDLSQGSYCYETSMAGDEVSTYGIVTHVIPQSNTGSAGNFFLQQPGANTCGGIFIRDFDIMPSLGDELTLSGTVNEYYSFTQLIDITSFSQTSTGNITTPMIINTDDLGIDCSLAGEQLEGMLVKINNVTIEGIDEFGNIVIDDGSGSTLMDDYYFDGSWPNISVGDTYSSIVGVVAYSYNEFKIYPRNASDLGNCTSPGDMNGDSVENILDIVILASCVLDGNCSTLENACAGDLNDDGTWNILDIVNLANCVLNTNCSGRIDDASESRLIIQDNMVSIEADGFIGGVQMTLTHGNVFTIEMTNNALFAEYLTSGNETRILIVTPETDELFTFSGDFEIAEIIIANSQEEVSVDLPLVKSFNLKDAYPNPFNPTTSIELSMPVDGFVSVIIYNIMGQLVTTLHEGTLTASENNYLFIWDASNLPSGMYFVRAESADYIQTQKLLLLK